jgi:DNA excision repair protein ERCC-4
MNASRTCEDFPAKLATLPTVVIDTREQTPLPITRVPMVRAGLATGDYSILGAENLFAVERKSIADLIASATTERERFERELQRMRGYEFRRLLIVGTRLEIERHNYRSNATPRAVLASLSAFNVRYAPVVFVPDAEAAARIVEQWALWFAYSLQSTADAIACGSKTIQNFEPVTSENLYS